MTLLNGIIRKVELAVSKKLNYKCPVRRVSFPDLANKENVRITEDRRFFYQGIEVATFYMRDGYEYGSKYIRTKFSYNHLHKTIIGEP